MGMFDTIYFDKKYACPICNAEIDSIQTKEFENLLNNYYVKDCISHAEDGRIIKGELFCDACSKHIGKNIYIVVARGILLGITDTLEDARNLLNSLNLEKLTLWYHDLYQKYITERKEKKSYGRFLNDLCNWYNKGLYEKPDEQITEQLWLMWSKRHLKGALNPIESIERFLTSKKMEKALNKLWNEGQEILDIYYPEDIDQVEELWSVDVYQDELNERCHLNWTWTVISKKQLELDGEKEDHQPEWVIVVDALFSDEVIREAIEKWLRDNGHKFEVRMISFEQAKGSGMVKKLREMVEIKKEGTMAFETLEKQLAEETIKKTAGFIGSKKDRGKVFYYKGFYGSLIPDVENDRLLGKIEDIDKDIVYEGKTVKECEQKFREAIDQYLT